jgi:hypothetical protein
MLERDLDMTAKIAAVRAMPQENEDQTWEKRNLAKLVRMQSLLNNAALTYTLHRSLESNHGVKSSDLQQQAQSSGYVVFPANTEKFIQTIADVASRVTTTKSAFESDAENHGLQPSEIVYANVVPKKGDKESDSFPIFPEGETVLHPYPLAVTLEVQDRSDFGKIDPRKNVLGFYHPAREYRDVGIKQSPFIGIFAEKQFDGDLAYEEERDRILNHEKGHALNMVFKASLPGNQDRRDRRRVWSKYPYNLFPDLSAQQLKKQKKSDDIDKSGEWGEVMGYVLGHTKDEFIAGMVEGRSVDKNLERLLIPGYLYDRFHRDLGIRKGTKLHEKLWKYYRRIIETNIEPIEEIASIYTTYGLGLRKKIFPFVLAQIPIENWSRQLHATLFLEEAYQLDYYYRAEGEHIYYDNVLYKPSRPELVLACRKNQTGPLLPLITDAIERDNLW